MTIRVLQGDWIEVLRTLPDESVHCVVTSPPYWGLRDYGVPGQVGLERTPEEYVAKLVEGFREVRRVLRRDGTCWVNLGDSYASGGKGGGGSFMAERRDAAWQSRSELCGWKSAPPGLKHKDLVGIPWRVAFALQADGWWLRQDIIWAKPNPMPESVTDRCTKAHEYIFLLTKNERYYYDTEAVKELSAYPGDDHSARTDSRRGTECNSMNGGPNGITRNKRSVWTVSTKPFSEAHFATFPPEIPATCIKAGCPEDGTVLDLFHGAGTTGVVASRLGRSYIGIELNLNYHQMAENRIVNDAPLFNVVERG